MQPRGLPSLTALTAFEAAARLESFKGAASELNVTAPAISRQIRILEAELGSLLFNRGHRQVNLTAEGEKLFDAVSDAFRSVSQVVQDVSTADPNQIRIGSTNAVATYWLIPRLGDFWRQHPEINLHHLISDQMISPKLSGADLAIRFGLGGWPDVDATLLYQDRVFPVCSPTYAKEKWGKAASRVTPEELCAAPLLEVGAVREEGWLGWKDWLAGVGSNADPKQHRHVNNYVVAVQSAIDGLGVVLGWESLVQDALRTGRLIRLSSDSHVPDGGFFAVTQKGEPLKDSVRVFQDWLLEKSRRVSGNGAAGVN